jgi:hypothetical protein
VIRTDIIAGAINAYCSGENLPTTPERVAELARFIDGHLTPDVRREVIVFDHIKGEVRYERPQQA